MLNETAAHNADHLVSDYSPRDLTRLQLYPLARVDHIAQPAEAETLDWNAPALAVFTDFKLKQPLTVKHSGTVLSALAEMRRAHVHLKLVVNEQGQLVGLIDSHDVSEDSLLQFLPQGLKRDDILVSQVMKPVTKLETLDYHELSKATVKMVVKTLRNEGLQHCLVVEHGQHEIRGIISARDVARRLRIPVDVRQKLTFYDVFKTFNHD